MDSLNIFLTTVKQRSVLKMGLLNLFGKKDVQEELQKQAPFRLVTEFIPYRIHANVRNSALMVMKIKNMTNEAMMTSVVVEIPKQLSFDSMGMAKSKELRLGDLAPSEEKEQRVEIYGDTGTDKGEYTITLTAFAHYRDYGHVLNAMKKRTSLQTV